MPGTFASIVDLFSYLLMANHTEEKTAAPALFATARHWVCPKRERKMGRTRHPSFLLLTRGGPEPFTRGASALSSSPFSLRSANEIWKGVPQLRHHRWRGV